MSFTPKSIIFNIGMFLLTLLGSLYVVGLVVPGKSFEARFESRMERRGHRENDRRMLEELESLKQLNESLEEKIEALEQRLEESATGSGLPTAPVIPVKPVAPLKDEAVVPKAANGPTEEF